ncbi:MAG: flippase-like domain-containing protein [Flavobacteriales bacterium]|nr:flippase-like domain-containing protein [Flavobacteriales bacterium]
MLILFRWGIFLLACVFLWKHLSADKGRQALEALTYFLQSAGGRWGLLAVLALMGFNWWLESEKWRRMLSPVERVGRGRAFVATVAGTSVGLVTPNRTGEFLGRILFLDPAHRFQGAFATALGSIAQFVTTMLMGGLALVLMLLLGLSLPWPDGWISAVLISLTALVTIGASVLYMSPSLLRQLVLRVSVLRPLSDASTVLDRYTSEQLRIVLGLSAARYVVFASQFVLLLWLFGSGVGAFHALLAVAVVYLVATMVPTVMLTELGVRGSVALAVFLPLGGAEVAVLLATTVVWVVNLVLPATVGSVLLLLARIRTRSRPA